MATDYVVRFTGLDNLSGTINQVRQRLEDVGGSTTQLDSIQQKFQKIEQSTAPLKRKLRDLKNLMALMNLDGLSGTDLFNRMAEQAGTYADALGDATTATNVFANDNFKLEAMALGLTGIAGAASIATGVMGVLGTENELVALAIMKVQSVLAILNGVQAVANVLNKDSAFMLRLKQIRTAASTAATRVNTGALGANTVAEALNGATTKKGTIIQNAWNIAKAVAKALLGDFTGLVLVGAGALLTYALATENSTAKTEENTEAVKDSKTEYESFKEAVANAITSLVGKYVDLQVGWKKCKDELEQNLFIKDNQSAFNELGIAINNTTDAENYFNGNTDAIVTAINRRAEAMAYLDRLKNAWSDKLTAMDSLGGEDVVKELVGAGSVLTQAQEDFLTELGNRGVNTFGVWNNAHKNNKGLVVVTGVGAREFNELWMTQKHLRHYDVDTHNQYLRAGRNILDYSEDLAGMKLGTTHTNKPPKTTSKPTNTVPAYDKGSLAAEEAELTRLQDILKNTRFETDAAREAAILAVRDLAAKVEQMKLLLKWQVEPELDMSDDTITGLTNQIQKIEKRLRDEVLTPAEREQLAMERNIKIQLRENLLVASGLKERKTEQPKTRSEVYSELKGLGSDVLSDFDNGLIDKDEAIRRISEINAQIAILGGKPIQLEFKSNFDEVVEDFTAGINAINGVDGVVKSVQTLSQSLKEGADAWSIFMNAVSVASSVLSAISTIMETYNILSSIFTAKKTAEGAATSAASTAITTATTAKAAADTASIAPAITATAAAKALEAAYLDLAAAAYFAAHAYIPFSGFGIAAGFVSAMMGKMAALTAASAGLAAFADGGIVSGNTFHGDRILARVNAGEMVLNQKQQGNLFKALNSGSVGAGRVEFEISGNKLVGVLRNYNNKLNKIK